MGNSRTHLNQKSKSTRQGHKTVTILQMNIWYFCSSKTRVQKVLWHTFNISKYINIKVHVFVSWSAVWRPCRDDIDCENRINFLVVVLSCSFLYYYNYIFVITSLSYLHVWCRFSTFLKVVCNYCCPVISLNWYIHCDGDLPLFL